MNHISFAVFWKARRQGFPRQRLDQGRHRGEQEAQGDDAVPPAHGAEHQDTQERRKGKIHKYRARKNGLQNIVKKDPDRAKQSS